MSKICPKCGVQLDDNATFCTTCGERLNAQPTNRRPNAKKPALPNKKLLMLAGAAIVAIIAIILVFSLIFPSPKAIAKKYVSGYIKGNATRVVNCMPSFMFEDRDEKKEAIEDLEDMLEEMELDEYDKIKYEVKGVNKLSKDEREDLEDRLEMYEEYYDDFDADSINVKRARVVEVKITVKDGGDTHRSTVEILVVKYRGQWKVLTASGFDFD